jgi:TonB family protein
VPPDHPLAHPPPGPPPQTGEARTATPSLLDPAARAPPEEGPPELVWAWAPFPVEFGQSWVLDPDLADLPTQPEPELVFEWAPFPVEFAQSWWIDSERTTVPEAAQPPARERTQPFGLLASFTVHLLPLLVLLDWARAPVGLSGGIPVRLVLEQPPAATEKTAVRDRPATPDNGETIPQAQDVTAPAAAQPARPQAAAVAPPPAKPSPPPKPVPPVSRPLPQPTPRPQSQPQPAATTAAAAQPQAQRAVATAGAGAVQGDYFSYLVTLTRRHSDLLPMSFLAGRRGETILSVVVLGDGTIGRIAVKRSSGYPDIDARIEQMVAAVGRFPPPPQRYQGSLLDMDFRLAFPNGLEGQ